MNRFERADEKAFEAVNEVSEFNQRGYELFAQPFVQAMSNEYTAQLLRQFHPLRFQNWAISRFNPWLSWLAPAAQTVKANRQAIDERQPLRRAEKLGAELVSASLDYYRATRDAMTEAGFFTMYANIYSRYLADEKEAQARADEGKIDARELPIVRDALASIGEGGYVEALARVAFLLKRKGEPLPLSRLELRHELVREYAEYIPGMSPYDWRRIRGEQEIISQYEPDRAVETLPRLLDDEADRERLLALLDKLMADKRVQGTAPTAEQVAMLERIREVLADKVEKNAPRGCCEEAPRGCSEEARLAQGRKRSGSKTREVPAPDRLLQDPRAHAHGRRASLRSILAAGCDRCRPARADRADSRRAARAHTGRRRFRRHRSLGVADRRCALQP